MSLEWMHTWDAGEPNDVNSSKGSGLVYTSESQKIE